MACHRAARRGLRSYETLCVLDMQMRNRFNMQHGLLLFSCQLFTPPCGCCFPHCGWHVVQLDTPKLQLAHKLARVRAGAILFPTYRMHRRYLCLNVDWQLQWSPRCQSANPTVSAPGNIRYIIIPNIIIIDVLGGAAPRCVTLGAA